MYWGSCTRCNRCRRCTANPRSQIWAEDWSTGVQIGLDATFLSNRLEPPEGGPGGPSPRSFFLLQRPTRPSPSAEVAPPLPSQFYAILRHDTSDPVLSAAKDAVLLCFALCYMCLRSLTLFVALFCACMPDARQMRARCTPDARARCTRQTHARCTPAARIALPSLRQSRLCL